MFRRLVLICFLGMLFTDYSYSQSTTIDTYTNELLFNIFTEKPDPSIQDFIKTYVPILFEKKKKEDVWIMNGNKHTQPYQEVHTFIFFKHPFVKSSFTSGKIEFYCQRNGDPKNNLITNVKLWFEFDTQLEAEMAYGKLMEIFVQISTDKHFGSTNGAQTGEFTDANETRGFGRVRLRLTADNLDRRTFKILFETENDM